jgi:hypothetical protein
MATLTVELPTQQSLTEQNLRRWAEVISDPRLARLEERIETDRFGRTPCLGASWKLSIQDWRSAGQTNAAGPRRHRIPNLDC